MSESLSLFERRRSVRHFKEEMPADAQLSEVMDAITLSPSACNEQAWFFVVIKRREIIAQIESLHEPAGNCYNAPVLLIAYAKDEGIAPDTDTDLAIASAMFACTEAGLGSCYIYFVQEVMNCPAYRKLNTALGVPEGYHCRGALAVGIPAAETEVPKDRRKDIFSIIV